MKIGILGTGAVGLALGKGWVREQHTLVYGSREPSRGGDATYGVGKDVDCTTYADAVKRSEVVVFAIPHKAMKDTVTAAGGAAAFKGRTVIDATNAIGPNYELAVGFTTSAAEDLQKMVPGAHVVKAFNTVFADNLSLGRFGSQKLAAFVAGDDATSKKIVLKLAEDLGFEPVDAGPLKAARYLEPMAMMLIGLAYGPSKTGPGIALALMKKK